MRKISSLSVLLIALACSLTVVGCGKKPVDIEGRPAATAPAQPPVVIQDRGNGFYYIHYTDFWRRNTDDMAEAIANVIKEHPGSTVIALTGDGLNGEGNAGFFLFLSQPSK